MTITDPITNVFTRLRNANQAYQESTSMSSSEIKVGIAEILKAKGYISSFELTEVGGQVGKVLKITLKCGDSCERFIAGLRRTNKPGLCVYAETNALPRVLDGLSIAIVSIFQGLLTDRQANVRPVGSEVLAYV